MTGMALGKRYGVNDSALGCIGQRWSRYPAYMAPRIAPYVDDPPGGSGF